jgi:hypothetical protein
MSCGAPKSTALVGVDPIAKIAALAFFVGEKKKKRETPTSPYGATYHSKINKIHDRECLGCMCLSQNFTSVQKGLGRCQRRISIGPEGQNKLEKAIGGI